MSNNPKNKKIMPKPPQKPNTQLWLIISAVVILIAVTLFNKSNATVEVSQKKFEEMMLAKDVKKVVLIRNQNQAEITLKEGALENSKYKDELEQRNMFLNQTCTHYILKVVSR